MSKTQLAKKLYDKIDLSTPVPDPIGGIDLIQEGLNAVLRRRLSVKQASSSTKALIAEYPDWNELRVSQAQEIAGVMGLRNGNVAAAVDVKTYLQEIFQNSHGLELEFLRDDPAAGARFVSQLPFLGLPTGSYILYVAQDRQLPITSALVRVLGRLGLMTRSTSIKKARAAIEPLIPEGKRLGFAMRFGEVAARWCDPRKPLCWECVLVEHCAHGKKVHKDWKEQQAKLEVQRAREAARQEAQAKKEEQRRKRDEERARQKAEVEAKKRARELERRRRVEDRKRERIAAAAAREKAKEQARKKREEAAKKKEARRKKLEAERLRKKKAEAKLKEAARKKAALKKKAAKKKTTAKKKTSTKKKTSARKPSASSKKPAARKSTARKPAAKKKAPKKAPKKKTGGSSARKKSPTKKKGTAKKKTAPRSKKRPTRRR